MASAIFTASDAAIETHASTTDREAKLYKKGKGKEAKLSYIGNVMTENRNGFVVEAELRQVSGTVERETAKDMIVRYSPGARAHHRRCRQGLRHGRLRGRHARTSTLRRTWLKIRPIVSLPSTPAPPAIPDTKSASRSANGLRSRSDGARPSADWLGRCCVA